MARVSVTDLKANLARYLRMVRRGSEVEILERGIPVARIVAVRPGKSEDAGLQALVQAGIVRRGTGNLAWVLSEPPPRIENAKLGEALAADRRDRF
jgi:prevent-host-death family protein